MPSQEPKPAVNTKEPSDQNQKSAHSPNREAPTPGAEKHAPETKGKRRESRKEDKHWLDYATGAFAFIAAIGGIGAGIAGAYQGWVARDAEIVANKAVLVSNSWSAVTYDDTSSKEREWLISPVIENTGNTPTKNLRYITRIGICIAGKPTKQLIDLQMGNNWSRKTDSSFEHNVIGPKSSITTKSLHMTNSTISCTWAGDATGIVKFEDIFGNPHLFEFCTLMRLPNIDFQHYPAGQPIHIQATVCPYHNCNDDECGEDWKERATD